MKLGALSSRMLLLAAVGCGYDHSKTDPVSECKQVATSQCETSANCGVSTGKLAAADRSANITQCLSDSMAMLDCNRVTGFISSGSPEACETDIVHTPCSGYQVGTGLPAPASCTNVFGLPDAGATDAGDTGSP